MVARRGGAGRAETAGSPAPWLVGVLQVVFVLLYSSGFIVGTIATNAASPFAIIFWRFIIAGSLLTLTALVMRAPWPRTWQEWRDIAVTGLLLQTLHYAGTYLGFYHGISASLLSMILGMMPLLVALGAWQLLREPLTKRQTLGTIIGFGGLLFTTAFGLSGGDSVLSIAYTALGCAGLSAGTLYQRKFGVQMDLRSGGALQLYVGAIGMLPFALAHDGLALPMSGAVVFSLVWLSTLNSLGAITLLLWFLKHQTAGEASSLFYLMPGVTAIAAWPLLGQSAQWYSVVGLLMTGVGLLLVTRYSRSAIARRELDASLTESAS